MDKIKELFRAKGLKATAQRLIVYDVLRTLGHAPVDCIVQAVHRQMPSISVASVYNILETLASHQLVSKLLTSDNKLHYDITAVPHHHLYDDQLHRIADFSDPELTRLVADYLASHSIEGFEPHNIRVQIVGKFQK